MLSNNYIIKSYISNTINTRQKYHIHRQDTEYTYLVCLDCKTYFVKLIFSVIQNEYV